MAIKGNLALQRPRNLDRLFRRRINYGYEVRAQLRLRNNLELRLFARLQTFIRQHIRIQAKRLRGKDLNLNLAEREFLDDLRIILRGHYKRVFLAIYERNTTVYRNLEKKEDAFDFSNVDFERLVGSYIATNELKLEGISRTLTKKIKRIIERGAEEGLGPEAIARDLEKAAPVLSRVRAHTIARTETHTAASWANHRYHLNLAGNLDLDLVKRWVSVSDGRTRPEHRSANGQTVKMNEKFVLSDPKLGQVSMDTAGDSAGGIYQIINCRCVVVYEEMEPIT